MPSRLVPTLFMVSVLAIGCGGSAAPHGSSELPGASTEEADVRLTLTGSSTVAPLVAEIAKRFEAQHPGVRVDVQTGGSSRGIRDVHSGAADLGMSSRSLKAEERAGVYAEVIGWDGVAFVVHRNNPVERLSREQLVGIYTGQIANWQEVGGLDAPIIVSNRAEGRSELDLMSQYLTIEPAQIQADVIDGETQQTIKTVTTNRHAITYTSVGAAQHAVELGEPLKLLPLDSVAAETQTVQSGAFPLARPLLLVVPESGDSAGGSSWPQRFAGFAGSPGVEDLTRSLGFVPPQREAPPSSGEDESSAFGGQGTLATTVEADPAAP